MDQEPLAIRTCLSNNPKYNNNQIQTSKYTWYSFLPRNIFEQFTKLANFYFLLLAILQTIPSISITDGQPTILLPLVVIFAVTALKDLYEDYKRKVSDRQENESVSHLIDSDILWQQIRVGQIVKVCQNEFIPADLLLLHSSDTLGVCFVETKNLDGETNLKQKLVSKDLLNYFQNQDDLSKPVSLEYDTPNQFLYQFKGVCYLGQSSYQLLLQKENRKLQHQTMMAKNKNREVQQYATVAQSVEEQLNTNQDTRLTLNINNILLRGSSLKHTDYIYGLVIYAGHETKIMMNLAKPKYKKSQLEHQLNKQIILIFLIQIAICIFAALYYSLWFRQKADELPYLEVSKYQKEDRDFSYNIFARFGNWLLMFGNLVPISLLVTLETVKFCQAFMIQIDYNMKSGEIPCAVQSSNLNEELGQIDYIFSDKTGTLTQNLMVFKHLCVDGVSYGEKVSSAFQKIENVDFSDPDILADLQKDGQKERILLTLILIGLCHNAVIQTVDGKKKYNTSSPDELALLNFAKLLGVEYQGVDKTNKVTLLVNGSELKYQFYHNLEFDSNRKRSSVIVKDLQENKIYLLSKGADSVMLERARQGQDLGKFLKLAKEYSQNGLRILILGFKLIGEKEFANWDSRYNKALTVLQDREKCMYAEQDLLEQNFEILGITAIEDRLQENVGECIAAFREAGIKVWVLTGDKIETAINIGYSCKLLDESMTVTTVNETSSVKITQQMQPCDALVFSGDALHVIFQDEALLAQAMIIAQECRSVLCCRVSPAQKEQVVRVVQRFHPEVSTLAIGDGANDVSMITSAHVGIGIKGVEGQQAARASDYSIGEFQLLRQLLFVHGRECYRRNADLILYNFYKNVVLVFPQFWFSIYNHFSGQRIYDNIVYQLYNIFYTSMPIMIFAVFDKEYEDEELIKNSQLHYQIGLQQTKFNRGIFWLWFFEGIYHSVMITFLTVYIIEDGGYGFTFWWTGTLIFGLTIVVANLKIIIISNTWTIAHGFFFLGMFVMYLITLAIFYYNPDYEGLYYIYDKIFPKAMIHLNNLVVIAATNMTDYAMTKLFQKETTKRKVSKVNAFGKY